MRPERRAGWRKKASAPMAENNSELEKILGSLDRAAHFDLSSPLRTTARIMEDEARNTFRNQSDPWGHPWPPHAESTLAARRRRGNTRTSLLIDTAAMYDGIERASDASSASVTIPAPAEVHQGGTTTAGRSHNVTIPPRPMFPEHNGVADLPAGYLDRITAPLIAALAEAFQ
jgi:phage gpG-like protein